MPNNYLAYTYQPLDSTGIFMNDAYKCSSTPLQMLNVSTIDFSYELRWLYWMRAHNISVKYLELGNEFYNEPAPYDYRILFPNVYYYVDAMQKWIKDIRSAFPTAQTMMMGGSNVNSADPSQASFTIANMRSYIAGKTGYVLPNAFSLHEYPESGLGYYHMYSHNPTTFKHDLNNFHNDSASTNLNSAAAGIFSYISTIPFSLSTLYGATNTTPIFITEYNINEKNFIICGSWLHGLYVADLALHNLEDTVIRHIYCHDIADNAENGSLFSSDTGYKFPSGDGIPSVDLSLPTTTWALTAQGEALRLVANAMKDNNSVRQISFSSSGTIHTFHDYKSVYSTQQVLYGWRFTGPADTSLIILNLDSTTFTADISGAINNSGNWESIFPPKTGYNSIKYNPMLFDTANLHGVYVNDAGVTTSASLHDSSGTFSSSSHSVRLQPYSITYVHNTTRRIYAIASVDTACVGTYVTLSAYLASANVSTDTMSVTWSSSDPSHTTITTIGNMRAKVSSTVANHYTFTVKYSTSPSYTVTVVFVAKPSVTLSPSLGCSICLGSEATISASGAQKYLWSPSYFLPSTTDPTSSSISFYPVGNDTFTLDVKNNGCYIDYYQDRYSGIPFISAGPNKTICSGDSVTIGPLVRPPGVAHLWLNDNDTNLDKKIGGLTASTKYIMQWKEAYHGPCDGAPPPTTTYCYGYDTVLVTVIQCCKDSAAGHDFFPNGKATTSYTCKQCNTNGTDITNFPYITSSYLLGYFHHPSKHTITSKKIILNGPVYIDSNINFLSDSLMMGDYAQIIVNPLDYCWIDSTKMLSACKDTMWRGIVIDKNKSSVKNFIRGSSISDAMVAVEASRESGLTVTKTTFDNNEIGIHLYNYANNISSVIWGNTFDNSAGTSILPPFNHFRGYAGIIFDTIQTIQVGNLTNKGGNTFEHTLYGIVSYTSQPTVYHSTFTNLINNNLDTILTNGKYIPVQLSSNLPSRGTGIFAGVQASNPDTSGFMIPAPNLPNILIVGGSQQYQPDTFLTCNQGVVTSEATTKVYSSLFGSPSGTSNNVTNGIVASFALNRNYFFKFNSIYASKEGIKIAMPNIYDNNSVSIDSNVVIDTGGTITSGIYSIDISNVGAMIHNYSDANVWLDDTVKNNDIYLNRSGLTGDSYGISLANCNHLDVAHNGVDSNLNFAAHTPSISMAFKRGIYLAISDSDTVHCNVLDHADFGFQALHAWTGSAILGNTFYKHNRAVMVGDSLLNITGVVVNQIGDSVSGTSYTPGNIFKSHPSTEYHLYKYDPSPLPTNITYWTGSGENFSSYKVHLFQAHTSSKTLYNCSGSNILIDKEFLGINSAPQDSFLDDVIENNFLFPQQYSNSMYFSLKLDVYNLLNGSVKLRNSSPEYQVFYDTTSSTDIGKISQVNSLISEISDSVYASQVRDLINQALSLNNSIAGQQIEEVNLKQVNDILLNTLAEGIYSYTSTQKSELLTVANQCPFSGGAAVYQARAMIMLFNDSLTYNDYQFCHQNDQQDKRNKTIQSSSFILYPNPTDGQMHLAYSTSDLEKYFLKIYDATGRLLYAQSIFGGNGVLLFNLSKYTSGIYFYNIISSQKDIIKKGSFVVIK